MIPSALITRCSTLSAAFTGMKAKTDELEVEMAEELERVKRSFRAEIVRYEPPGSALNPAVRREMRRRG